MELEWDLCSREAFDYGDYESKNPLFYPTRNTAADLDIYGSSLRCLKDKSDSELWGHYHSGNAGSLMVVFEKCDSEKRSCASEGEIAKWMMGRYIITLENQRKFVEHQFDDERFMSSAEIKWYPLNSDSRNEFVNII